MNHLNQIRAPQKSDSVQKQVLVTAGVLLLGACLGCFSKYLDYRQAELPGLLAKLDELLDFHNFLGGFAPWIVIALCLSVYSRTPFRAAVNVFCFFVGFVASYYLYSALVAGFFPSGYALVWIAFTVASPFLGFFCWYAKGKGPVALLLSAAVIGVLLNTAFAYGVLYLDLISRLNLVMLFLALLVLRKPMKQTLTMLAFAAAIAVLLKLAVPFAIW